MNRSEIVDKQFIDRVRSFSLPDSGLALTPAEVGLSNTEVIDLFESQVISRHLDLMSRRLATRKESFYTIGSSGHEGNAAFGKVFRLSDMAFLHYRSCAFMVQRSKQLPGQTPIYDTLLSFAASSEDPISGGRHKVFGSKALLVPPQTSTIASHLPKAVGMAHAIGLARRIGYQDTVVPSDSVVVCNFGDASANHSTAQGAVNTAGWSAYQGSPMPIVFICEDNGIGISTSTPRNWIKASFEGRAGIHYLHYDGLNILDAYRAAKEAEQIARQSKKPVFLHCRTVRLMGHAGSDIETGYRSVEELELDEAQDPLLHTARILLENQILTVDQLCAIYQQTERRISRVAEVTISRPKLTTSAAVMASIAPEHQAPPKPAMPEKSERDNVFNRDLRLMEKPQNMARLINLALADIMLQYPQVAVCGEDVGKKGGVYGVTSGLQNKFGRARVIDTLLDEQSILGLAIGLSHNGLLPIPEIQFLAYVHNAEDQIRGEAATLSFFSNGQFQNPMVIRIAGLAYQKGFGGHFHNDNSFNVFRDIPGIVLACPSNGRDAVQMLRTSVALAHEQKRVVIFLEPIALYMTKDLYSENDGLWMSLYEAPDSGEAIAFGDIGIAGDGKELCILTYGNGYYLSLKAVRQLKEQYNMDCRVIDLRWLAPLNRNAIIAAVKPCENILIVDECRRSGSVSEELITLLSEENIVRPVARLTAEDSYIPLGAAANLVLLSEEGIITAAVKLCQKSSGNVVGMRRGE